MKQHDLRGFSLIELMIVVAIIAILGAIAYPAYTDSVMKGRRAQARTALGELMQQQERYMTQRNCYLGFTTSATFAATVSAPSPSTACGGTTQTFTTFPFKTYSGDSTANAAYKLEAGVCPGVAPATLSIAECVQVTATPRVADPKVNVLQMTSTGVKTCTGSVATAANNYTDRLCWP